MEEEVVIVSFKKTADLGEKTNTALTFGAKSST